jgi:hypothetical protein
MYKKVTDIDGSTDKMVLRKADNAYIPADPANTDYQEYLEWVAEGNTPEEAE